MTNITSGLIEGLAPFPTAYDDRAAALDAYRAVRTTTESLAAPLGAEDQQVQSMADASPAKWHRAHVTWFFETFLLLPHGVGYRPFHPEYGYLFNSYYEGAGPRYARPHRGLLTRPTIEDIARYRAHVDAAMERLIADSDAETWDGIADLFVLGLNHEQQHQELLLTDIKHAFSINPLAPAYIELPPPRAAGGGLHSGDRQRGWFGCDGGLVDVGYDGNRFGFDNEFPCHRQWVEPFEIATRSVTNAQYRAFVEDGGYGDARHWLSDGWAVVQEQGWERPFYWRDRDGGPVEFTLGGERPLDDDAPVSHLSFYEADAYARWAGGRLPSEAEWETAARQTAIDEADANLLAEGRLHPAAPSVAPAGQPAQMFGDVWEWTQSAYAPYPGFSAAAGAVGEYNGKFMANQMTLRGGSCITPPGHVRISYRNFFYPDQRWQFSGLRLARGV